MLVPVESPFVAFEETRVFLKGIIRLMVHAAERTFSVNFLVMESRLAFNAFMGRGWIHAMHGVVLTLHQVMRYQSPFGRYTIDIRGGSESGQEVSYDLHFRWGKHFRHQE